MILEIATLHIKPGTETDFENAIERTMPILERAKGCRDGKLYRSVDTPLRYFLLLKWDNVENHTVDFRMSDDISEWREAVAPFYTDQPIIEHTQLAVNGF